MPFQERSIVSHREEFCRLALLPGSNIRALCRLWLISSATAYKWLRRFTAEGTLGLHDRSRRPLGSPHCTSPAMEAQVLAVRRDHPAWGGRKIGRVLESAAGERPPSASTITQIIRRHGLLDGPRAGQRRDFQRFEHAAPNDLWQMDFKGHFALQQGRCHPLTVLDDHSRFSLEIGACADEQTATVRTRLQRVFARNGLPRRILTDNGSPWGTTGPERHTPLSLWLMDLGIGVIHGRPHHPQTQGKDERFHRSLNAEVLNIHALVDLPAAQAAFDAWREIYNTKRPHEGIGMATPASRYRSSERPMPGRIDPPDYEPSAHVRKVQMHGRLSFKGRQISCPRAFVGRTVALRVTNTDGLFDLCYRQHVLAQVDLRQNIGKPAHHVPEQTFTLSPV
jgi:transposase InsO family protein